MTAVLIVVPVFALIAAGYAAVALRLVSDTAHKGISEFAFSIAIPALLFRTVVLADFSSVSALQIWACYFGAVALTWIAALLLSPVIGQAREDGVVTAIGSVYGNIVMLGIPLTLSALGDQAAGPMALILSVNTPLLWFAGTLQMAWTERKLSGSATSLILPIFLSLARNPIMIAIGLGLLWRLTGLGLHPVADKTVGLLAQAGPPTALIALGINLFRFEIKGQRLGMAVTCALKLLAMPAFAWLLAFELLKLPPIAAGVVVLFAAMPAGANAYIFAVQYRRAENAVSGAVALGSILAAVTLPTLVTLLHTSPH
jgi:malonate transporter and related proteins